MVAFNLDSLWLSVHPEVNFTLTHNQCYQDMEVHRQEGEESLMLKDACNQQLKQQQQQQQNHLPTSRKQNYEVKEASSRKGLMKMLVLFCIGISATLLPLLSRSESFSFL